MEQDQKNCHETRQKALSYRDIIQNTVIEQLDLEGYQQKKCTWKLGESKENDPHIHTQVKPIPKIYNNVLDAISNSPMIRLNKIPQSEGVQCEILAKCEFYLPGGSLKDRIGKRMVQDAEKKGLLTPGKSTIIEATSGNTGIGLALVGAVKGYKVIITLPEKMSQEKSDVLNAFGADILRTPTEASFVDLDSHIGVARQLNKAIEDSIILDQYCNPSNALAHYDETAEEIWQQCDGKLDYVVISAGTGGCITGISRKLKEKNPNIQVFGVDPLGSILAYPEELNKEGIHSYKVEGIGYDFIPKNCDRTGNIDRWIKAGDDESFKYSRRLIREEGLLVGGSSGMVMSSAIRIAKELNIPADKRMVIVLVDGVRNYMTKFLNDDWMLENNFMSQQDYDKVHFSESYKYHGVENTISELKLTELTPVNNNDKVKEVLEQFKKQNSDCLPVVNDKKELVGIITSRQLTNFLTAFKLNLDQNINKAIIKEFKNVKTSQSLKYLSKAFTRHTHVLVTGEKGEYYVARNEDVLNHYLKTVDLTK